MFASTDLSNETACKQKQGMADRERERRTHAHTRPIISHYPPRPADAIVRLFSAALASPDFWGMDRNVGVYFFGRLVWGGRS